MQIIGYIQYIENNKYKMRKRHDGVLGMPVLNLGTSSLGTPLTSHATQIASAEKCIRFPWEFASRGS